MRLRLVVSEGGFCDDLLVSCFCAMLWLEWLRIGFCWLAYRPERLVGGLLHRVTGGGNSLDIARAATIQRAARFSGVGWGFAPPCRDRPKNAFVLWGTNVQRKC